MSGKKNIEKEMADLIRYQSGKMTGRERNAFERKMQRDPFLADAAEGLGIVSPDEAAEDIMAIERRLASGRRKRNLFLYSGAAAVLIFLVVSSVLLFRFAERQETGSIAIVEKKEAQADSLAGAGDPAIPQTDKRESAAGKSVVEGESVTERKTVTEGKTITEGKSVAAGKTLAEGKSLAGKPVAIDTAHLKSLNEIAIHADTPVSVAGASSLTSSKLRSVTIAEFTTIPDMARVSELAANQIDISKALQGKVSGLVISTEDSMPIPGAMVTIRGTQHGVVTDIDGRFTIPVTGDTAMILVASFIGMEKAEVRVSDREFQNIAMRPDILALDEVIVVGYGGAKSDDVAEYREPEPSEGYSVFNDYIRKNIRYPEGAEGRSRVVVVLDMPVSSGGVAGEPVVVRSPDTLFSTAAIKLIKEGPSWNPAVMNGKPIDDKVRIRIIFRK